MCYDPAMAWKRDEPLPLERVLRAATRVQVLLARARMRRVADMLEATGHPAEAQQVYAALAAPTKET